MSFKTILLLDDDPQFHKLIVPVLESRGHRVLSAHTACEADNLLKQETKFDLLVVDGQLPDTSGIDWIESIRSAGNTMDLIFVSAYWRDAQSYHKLTKELGVSFVLHKPVIPSVFVAEVDLLLGKAPGDHEAKVENVEDTLLALRAEYAKELPGKLKELSYALAQFKAQPDNFFLSKEARTRAHRLRGTAASYGFPQLGDVMIRVETNLVEIENTEDQDAVNRLWSQIEADVESVMPDAETAAREAQQIDLPAQAPPLPSFIPAIARILLVDDDEAFLDLIEELGREHQVEIIRASGAMEAMDKACLNQVDAALLDVELESRETAFKLASDLRNLPGYSSLPLAFISGSGHIENLETNNVDQVVYLDKKLEVGALKDALRQLIAIRQVARPRVLVVDDDVDFCGRMAFILGYEGMVVRTLDDTVSILKVMHEFQPELLVLDVMMPGVSGFDICRMLRTMLRWRDIPIIFVSAYSDVESRIAAFQSGADDYLCKPVVNEELLTRMHVRLERARSLRVRVDRDAITGLLLRRPFMEQLSGMLSEAQRHGWSVTVCLIDIDDFDQICEYQGYQTADRLLTTLGDQLQRKLRAEDLRGRWNGEFFIFAFRSETVGTVNQMIRRLLDDVAEMEFASDSGLRFSITCSAGLSRFPGDGSSIHELLNAAERRLRGAKTAGPKSFVSTG
jgi:diguanylate cyclase (GGDEF)-like protein